MKSAARTKNNFVATVLHRYLRVPYTLHVFEFRSPKKPRATFVFIHGIGNTLHSWDEVIAKMPRDVRLIGVDLLGFGQSPKPHWAVYDAKTQARSVGVTLARMHLTQRPIIVGHSLGALVAVELAKRYPFVPEKLVLCSPPFYATDSTDTSLSADAALRSIYKTALRHPDQLIHISPLLVKMGLANKSLSINDTNISSYRAALESSIINQTSLDDVATLTLPITILYGAFDPVVIGKHISQLEGARKNVVAVRLPYAHEILGGYVTEVATRLEQTLPPAHQKAKQGYERRNEHPAHEEKK